MTVESHIKIVEFPVMKHSPRQTVEESWEALLEKLLDVTEKDVRRILLRRNTKPVNNNN